MRGLEKIGRLGAGLLFAVLGMAASGTASAYQVTGNNLTAQVTADPYSGDAVLTFEITKSASSTINNGEFVFSLPGAGDYIVSRVPGNGTSCPEIVNTTTTTLTCSIDADISPVTFSVTVRPSEALLRYTWSARNGTGTNSPAYVGEESAIVTAAPGATVAGGSGTTLAVAETSITTTDGLKGTLTAKGKTTTDTIYVGVQELTSCSTTFYRFCIKFTAENAAGAKVYYPTDLSDLVKFAVYVNPPSLGITANIQNVTLYYGDSEPFTQLQSCPAKYRTLLKTPPDTPCIDSRSVLNTKQAKALGVPDGTWQFILFGKSNGYVSLSD